MSLNSVGSLLSYFRAQCIEAQRFKYLGQKQTLRWSQMPRRSSDSPCLDSFSNTTWASAFHDPCLIQPNDHLHHLVALNVLYELRIDDE